jgi:hypothetical protein
MLAQKPTIDFFPEWQTSIPMTIGGTSREVIDYGSSTLTDSPPSLELICFIMLEATERFIL